MNFNIDPSKLIGYIYQNTFDMLDWPQTEYAQIISSLGDFNERKYAGTRNFIDGGVSRLSPYLSRGCISTRMVFDAIVKQNPKALRGKFVQELLWRDYFQRLLQARPDLYSIPVREQKEQKPNTDMPAAVLLATTGITAIDDAITELYESGYMHNHFRMYVAALCCNIGKYQFQTPAKWMYYHLLDADIASNYASWQWVAGHITWKSYIANQENVNRYSRQEQSGTFLDKPYDLLAKMDVPEILSESAVPDLHPVFSVTQLPVIDDDLPILLYTFYNLDPLWHASVNCHRVLIFEPSHFAQFPVGTKVFDFTLALAANIPNLKIFCGEYSALAAAYPTHRFIAKEHPILHFANAEVEPRDWIVPEVSGYFQSFSKYYLKCLKVMQAEDASE